MRETLRRFRTLRRLVRWYRGRTSAYPRWSALLGPDWDKWQSCAQRAPGPSNPPSPRILLATSLGGYWAGTTLESVLGMALTLRGADVDVLLCDGILDACQRCEVRAHADPASFAQHGPQADLCGGCFKPGQRYFEELGFRVHRYSDWITPEELGQHTALARDLTVEQIRAHQLDGVPTGEHALAGALRFFARGDLESEPTGDAVLRRYFRAALTTATVSRRLFAEHDYTATAFHHGIYVPQGIIGAVARAVGLRVVNWTPAYRKQCFIFSHDDTYHHTLLDEPTSEWESIPFGDEERDALLTYLDSRRRGTEDWIWFHNRPREALESITREAKIPLDKPVIGLLTNVIWDAQLHYAANAFESMMHWVLETIDHFASRPDLHLVIRVHPAEIRGTLPSRQRVVDEVERAFPVLPANVSIVPPESEVSTYALLDQCNAALIYGTKTGVELAATGKPVIVAGEAWVRGKGFTYDAASREEYAELLTQLPLDPLDEERLERARRYAYHIFFRRMIPIEFMEATAGDPPYRPAVGSLAELEPGSSRGLDVVCDGILTGTSFCYPAEELGWVRS